MKKPEAPISFGDWLKIRRNALDLTQEELAGLDIWRRLRDPLNDRKAQIIRSARTPPVPAMEISWLYLRPSN